MQAESVADLSADTGASSVSWLALIVSGGTLVCCAMPIALVSLGFGATVAALTSALPLLVTLSEYKHWIFLVSGALLTVSAWFLFRRISGCPADPVLAARCKSAIKVNKIVFWLAAGVWSTGFVAAYLLLPIRIFLDV